eukprot:4048390-Amphidinium_carterae.1
MSAADGSKQCRPERNPEVASDSVIHHLRNQFRGERLIRSFSPTQSPDPAPAQKCPESPPQKVAPQIE